MLDYSPFWETLAKKKLTTYDLINKYQISSSTIQKLRNNAPLSTVTLDKLCAALQCDLAEIACYISG